MHTMMVKQMIQLMLIQWLAPFRSIKHAWQLLAAEPMEWFVMWLILNVILFISISTFMTFATGELIMLDLAFFIGIAHAAHYIDQDPELLYHNRGIDPFLASLFIETRFFCYLFGLLMVLIAIAWGSVLNHAYGYWGHGIASDSSSFLPAFLQQPMWQNLYLFGLMMCAWFTPIYLIHHGENVVLAIGFSIWGCLKNLYSFGVLMGLFSGLAYGISMISVSKPLYLLPLWAAWFILMGMCSYTHYCAISPQPKDEIEFY